MEGRESLPASQQIGLKHTSDKSRVKPEHTALMEHSDPTVVYDTAKLKPKRQVGLMGGMSYVVGSIIGSGIFITPQAVLRNTGSVSLCLTVWACGAVLSVLVFLMISNCYSMRLTTGIQIFCTGAKLLALVVIIVGGLVRIGKGSHSELLLGFEGSITEPSSIALAFYSIMWSYSGWNMVNYFIEETENPRRYKDNSSICVPIVYIGLLTAHIPLRRSMCRNFRNGPLSSIGGVVVVGVVYILTNVSYMAVMTRQELIQSLAVAQAWGDRVLGSVSWIIPIAVMISVSGGANGGVASISRVQFAAARDKNWWAFLSFVHVNRYTPMPSIIIHIVIASVMVFEGNITSLITFLSFAEWVFYGVCAICCFVLRFKIKDDPKRIKIPIFIPILFSLCCLFLVVTPIVQNPQVEILYAAIFIVAGLVFYVPMVYLDLKTKILERLEMYLQLLMEVAPSTYDPEDSLMMLLCDMIM